MRPSILISLAAILAAPTAARGQDSTSPRCKLKSEVAVADARKGLCGFDLTTQRFAGSPGEQARCLLREVKMSGRIGAPTAPARLTDRAGAPVPFSRQQLEAYSTRLGIGLGDIGLSGSAPISAEYFVIHDTSSPNCSDTSTPTSSCPTPGAFPPLRDDASWPTNRTFGGHKPPTTKSPLAHAWTNRVGASLVETPFENHISHLKFDYCHDARRKAGVFLGVENIQPRIAVPPTPAPGRANDRMAPVPGFTRPQYDRLALLYAAASVRRGHWLVPAFHAVIDNRYADGHDDPQNFEISQFADAVDRLVTQIEGAP